MSGVATCCVSMSGVATWPGKVTSLGSLPEKSQKVLNQTVIREAFLDLNPAADTRTTIVAVLSACDRRNTLSGGP